MEEKELKNVKLLAAKVRRDVLSMLQHRGYGHVGVVVGVNQGQSITIQEMNYSGPNGKLNVVYQSTIDWGHALSFNYIHARR